VLSTGTPVFDGYLRPDGGVGARNLTLVLSVNGLANRAAQRIAAAVPGVTLVMTPYGRGQYGEDKELHMRQLVGLGRNPNVAAVLVIGVDRAAADAVAQGIAGRTSGGGKPVEVAALDDTHEDALELSARGARTAGRLVRGASRPRHPPPPVALWWWVSNAGIWTPPRASPPIRWREPASTG
jgi:altronate dehydratase large subunit